MSKHTPEAVDFAVTSGMRRDRIYKHDYTPEEVFKEYETFKEIHMDTAALCKQQGLSFVPFIIEGHGGGWSAKARRLVDKIGRALSARDPARSENSPLGLAQRLSCLVHREGARALLRRLDSLEPGMLEGNRETTLDFDHVWEHGDTAYLQGLFDSGEMQAGKADTFWQGTTTDVYASSAGHGIVRSDVG